MYDSRLKIPAPPRPINVRSHLDLLRWSREFNCPVESLRSAIAQVGPALPAVQRFLSDGAVRPS